MSEISLYRLQDGKAITLQGDSSGLEKPLQNLIENNLDSLLRIRFLASEYATGKTHGGRIDSLGLDENACPTIIEYKRSLSENVINQGLYYLDWLLDHKAEFQLLVQEKLGQESAASIDWRAPRLICIATDFTKYDAHAIQQIGRNIELLRYRLFGTDLLLLEQTNTSTAMSKSSGLKNDGNSGGEQDIVDSNTSKLRGSDKSYAEWLTELSAAQLDLLSTIEDYMFSLGDDVQRKELKLYAALNGLKILPVSFCKKTVSCYFCTLTHLVCLLYRRMAVMLPIVAIGGPVIWSLPLPAARIWRPPKCSYYRPMRGGRYNFACQDYFGWRNTHTDQASTIPFAEKLTHQNKKAYIAVSLIVISGAESRNRTGTPCGAGF